MQQHLVTHRTRTLGSSRKVPCSSLLGLFLLFIMLHSSSASRNKPRGVTPASYLDFLNLTCWEWEPLTLTLPPTQKKTDGKNPSNFYLWNTLIKNLFGLLVFIWWGGELFWNILMVSEEKSEHHCRFNPLGMIHFMLIHPVLVEVFQSEQKWWSNQPAQGRNYRWGQWGRVVFEVFKNLKNKNFRFQNFYNSMCVNLRPSFGGWRAVLGGICDL